MRPNVIGDPELSNPTPAAWFNQAAFAVPQPFTFGSAGRHILRSDGLANLDLSVFRQFRITEGTRLEFRGEFFNASNSPQFAIPVNNQSFETFGRVLSTANAARQVQLGLKLIF